MLPAKILTITAFLGVEITVIQTAARVIHDVRRETAAEFHLSAKRTAPARRRWKGRCSASTCPAALAAAPIYRPLQATSFGLSTARRAAGRRMAPRALSWLHLRHGVREDVSVLLLQNLWGEECISPTNWRATKNDARFVRSRESAQENRSKSCCCTWRG